MSIGGKAQEESQYGYTNRDAFDFSQSSGGSFIDPNQQPFLDSLRQLAVGQYANANPGFGTMADQVGGSGMRAVDELGKLGNTQQVIDAQLEGLQSGLGEIYNQGISSLDHNAAAAGAFGGSRHGITEAALGGEIGDAFTRGYGDIISNANRQSIDANMGAIAGGGQMLNNALTGNFGMLQALQGIIGDPTILSNQESIGIGSDQTRSENFGSGQSAGFDFGFK